MTNNKTKKIETQSSDIGIEEVKKLATIFPQFVKDGKIDFDAMKAWFDNEKLTDNYEKFGLRFAGKQEAFDAIRRSSTGTLVPDKEQSVNWDETKNIFIEGENLEVLKLLQSHYRGKIKMIYIDPPYNTGKDFVYHDNFTKTQSDYYEKTSQTQDGIKMVSNPESNGRYHSDWLTMMYPRLFLAKNLLRDDGVIFVSIDDHEVAHLRMVMDEIFGEDNFVDNIIWKKRYGGGAKEKYFVSVHEYVLVYARDLSKIETLDVATSEEQARQYYVLKDEHFKTKGPYRTHPLEAGKAMDSRPNLVFDITAPDGSQISPKRQWLWSKERVEEAIEMGLLEFTKDKNGAWSIGTKQYLYDENGEIRKTKALSIIDNIYTQHGTNEMIEIFGNAKIFQYPKPTQFVKRLIEMADMPKDALVLDFFSGSGTTAHTVMQLNAEDGGSRKWILVQLPEDTPEDSEAYKAGYKNITQIARERIRRAGAKIGKGDTGFKAYKLAPSHYRQWQKMDTEETTPDQYVQILKLFTEKPLIDNYDEQSVVHEIFLKEGFDLHVKIGKHNISGLEIYSVEDDEKRLFVCFAKSISYEDIEAIKMKDSDTFVCFDSALTDTVKVNAQRNWTIKTI